MMIFCFYHNFSYTYYLLLYVYVLNDMFHLLFPNINNLSVSVNNSNFNSTFFKQACHANPGADINEQHQVHLFQYIYF